MNLYYRAELEAQYSHLVATAKTAARNKAKFTDWLDANCQELASLQMVLSKIPQGGKTLIVADHLGVKHCKALVNNNLCKNTFVAKYIDVDAIAEAIARDLPRVEVYGKVFYGIDLADFNS